jgi:hypothetical protein
MSAAVSAICASAVRPGSPERLFRFKRLAVASATDAPADSIGSIRQKFGVSPADVECWRVGRIDFGHRAVIRDVSAQTIVVIRFS